MKPDVDKVLSSLEEEVKNRLTTIDAASNMYQYVSDKQVEQVSKPIEGKHLPTNASERKRIPLYSGVLKYFPDALVAVAKVSQAGNDQHNPGQPLHWAREKSTDQEDTLMRHLLEVGTVDVDGHRHAAKLAWRALAILQLEIEKEKNATTKG